MFGRWRLRRQAALDDAGLVVCTSDPLDCLKDSGSQPHRDPLETAGVFVEEAEHVRDHRWRQTLLQIARTHIAEAKAMLAEQEAVRERCKSTLRELMRPGADARRLRIELMVTRLDELEEREEPVVALTFLAQ